MNGKKRNFHRLVVVILGFIFCSCGDLHYNAKIGNIERIQKGLEDGISIEKRDPVGNTALIIAAYSDKPETVKYLCEKGANVNAQNNNGVTALIYTGYYNLPDVAKVLMKYNPDKLIKDKYGNTALDYAEQYKHTDMISLLKAETK